MKIWGQATLHMHTYGTHVDSLIAIGQKFWYQNLNRLQILIKLLIPWMHPAPLSSPASRSSFGPPAKCGEDTIDTDLQPHLSNLLPKQHKVRTVAPHQYDV